MDEENNTQNVQNTENAQSTQSTQSTQNYNQKPKNGKKDLIIAIVIILVIVALAAAIVVCLTVFNKTEIDLSKYISIEFEGFEGTASVSEYDLVYDEDGLKEALESKSKATKLIEKIEDKVKLDNNTKLKNGDEVEVKVKVSSSWLKEKKIKLKSDTIKIKVSGLEEPDEVDLFKDIDITYSGVSPDLTVYVDTKSNSDFLKYDVTYKFRKKDDAKSEESSYALYGIKNGDKIVVTAEYDDSDLERYGYKISKDSDTTYEFTVKDQPEYVTETKQLSDTVKDEIKKLAVEKVKSEAEYNDRDIATTYKADYADAGNYTYDFTHTDPEFQTMYLATNKEPGTYSHSAEYNLVYVVYKLVYTDTKTSKTYDFYITAELSDVEIKSDKLEDKDNYYVSIFDNYNYESTDPAYRSSIDSLYKAFESDLGDDYTIAEAKSK